MGQHIKLTASDGFQFGGYRADPAGTPKAAVVVIQEIFGVNHHIRAVCDRLAGAGYVAIAPSIFDRIEPNFQSGYSPDEIAVARKFVAHPDWAAMLRDTQAAIDAVKQCRSGRHRRLLPRRQRRLCRRHQADGSVGGDRLLRRRHRSVRRRQAESADPASSLARRTRAFRSPTSRPSAASGPMSRSTPIPAPSTASIAMNGQATTRQAPILHGRAASASLPRI